MTPSYFWHFKNIFKQNTEILYNKDIIKALPTLIIACDYKSFILVTHHSWPTWPASWEICMQVRKQQLELDMEQQTGSK